jgi:hypothetical protein
VAAGSTNIEYRVRGAAAAAAAVQRSARSLGLGGIPGF